MTHLAELQTLAGITVEELGGAGSG